MEALKVERGIDFVSETGDAGVTGDAYMHLGRFSASSAAASVHDGPTSPHSKDASEEIVRWRRRFGRRRCR